MKKQIIDESLKVEYAPGVYYYMPCEECAKKHIEFWNGSKHLPKKEALDVHK